MNEKIITDYEKLSKRCSEIDTTKENTELRKIIVEMKNIIREDKLAYLAAPQIGYDRRIIVINFKGDLRTYVNPVLSNHKALTLSRETCISIPGKQFLRIRHKQVDVTYVNPLGQIKSERFMGSAAIAVQYLVDLLDGILLSDIGLELDEHWDTFTEEEKNEIFDCYLDSIDLKRKEVQEEVDNDPELKEISDGIKFMEAVQRGEVKLVPTTIHIDNADEVNAQIEKAQNKTEEAPKKRGRPRKVKEQDAD